MKVKYLDRIIIFLLSFYLLIDSINGFLTLGVGLDIKLSVLYKSIILILIIITIVNRNNFHLVVGISLFVVLITGEIVSISLDETTGNELGFIIQHTIKLITPLILFIYFHDLIRKNLLNIKKIEKVLIINCAVFLINIFLGIAGFGFSTYGSTDLGVKGFFRSGNEISMLMVVLSAFVLGKSYYISKKIYFFWVIVWIIVGFAVSTKTAMAANLLLVVLIPVMVEGRALIDFTQKRSYFFSAFLVSFFVSIFILINWFVKTDIYNRFVFVFNKQGLIGLILSDRDIYLANLLDLFFYKDSVFNLLFGKGASFFADKAKFSTELDLPDVFLWQGIIGVLIVLYIFYRLTKQAVKGLTGSLYPYAPVVLVTNAMLFVISNMAGHVFTSGMLGFIWPCFCVLAFIRKDQLPNKVVTK